MQGSKTHIIRHSVSNLHVSRYNAAKHTSSIASNFDFKINSKIDNEIYRGNLKFVMFIVEHNLPMRLLEHLPKLIQSIGHDSEILKHIKCSRSKGTNIILNQLGPASLEQIAKHMRNSFFSLIADETTDVSTKKCLAVVVRYYDFEKK